MRSFKHKLSSLLKELIFFGVIALIISQTMSHLRRPELKTDRLPELNTTLLDRSEMSVDQLKGRVTLVYIWASWCSVCSFQASAIHEIAREARPDLALLTIAVRSGHDDEVRALMRERGYTFPTLNDPRGVWSAHFGLSAYPTILIYNSEGALKWAEVGYTTSLGLKVRLALTQGI